MQDINGLNQELNLAAEKLCSETEDKENLVSENRELQEKCDLLILKLHEVDS